MSFCPDFLQRKSLCNNITCKGSQKNAIFRTSKNKMPQKYTINPARPLVKPRLLPDYRQDTQQTGLQEFFCKKLLGSGLLCILPIIRE